MVKLALHLHKVKQDRCRAAVIPYLLELPRMLLDALRLQEVWSSLCCLRADFVVLLDVLKAPGVVKSSFPWVVSRKQKTISYVKAGDGLLGSSSADIICCSLDSVAIGNVIMDFKKIVLTPFLRTDFFPFFVNILCSQGKCSEYEYLTKHKRE